MPDKNIVALQEVLKYTFQPRLQISLLQFVAYLAIVEVPWDFILKIDEVVVFVSFLEYSSLVEQYTPVIGPCNAQCHKTTPDIRHPETAM